MKTLGIVGFGQFGRFAASHLKARFDLLVCDLRDVSAAAAAAGVRATEPAAVAGADVVVLSVPVQALPASLAQIAPHLRPGTLVADVCSVKTWPLAQMRALLPEHVELVGTHPMFGPQSAAQGLDGHRIVVCPERCERIDALVAHLEAMGLEVCLCDAETHDREAAFTQALAQYLGRALRGVDGRDFGIRTPAADRLREVERIVEQDSWELFAAIETLNPFAAEMRRQVRARLDAIDDRLAASLEAAADVPPLGSDD